MKVELKRSEWECYIDTPDSVIETINSYFTYVLDQKSNAFEAQREMYKFGEMFREWGFTDSECNEVITRVINKKYKSNINRWSSILEVA
jgi:hypothetical protein